MSCETTRSCDGIKVTMATIIIKIGFSPGWCWSPWPDCCVWDCEACPHEAASFLTCFSSLSAPKSPVFKHGAAKFLSTGHSSPEPSCTLWVRVITARSSLAAPPARAQSGPLIWVNYASCWLWEKHSQMIFTCLCERYLTSERGLTCRCLWMRSAVLLRPPDPPLRGQRSLLVSPH